MNNKVTCESKFAAEYLKIQNEAINKRISLEFNKHNWLLKRLYNQTQKKHNIQAIKKNKTFKHKKSTKKSLTHATVPMNFYKEQDITNCKKTQTVPPPRPNIDTIQRSNKQNVKRDLHRTMHNIANSQIKKTRFQRNDNSVYPTCDPQRSIKHNLPIVFHPDRKRYVTCSSNTLTDTLSFNTQETSGRSPSNDSMLKKPERPAAVTNYIKGLNSERAWHESIRDSTVLENVPSKVSNEVITHHNDGPIHLWNNNNSVLYRQKNSNNYTDSEINKNIKIDEESIKIILELCKENENVILETYMSKLADLFNHAKDNAKTDTYRIIKVARTISEIYKIIADTVTQAVEQIFSNKSTQTGMNNRLEYTKMFPTATMLSNSNPTQSVANNDKNKDCINLQQQELNKKNYQVYQQQQKQTNFPPYKTNETFNYENQLHKDFRHEYDAGVIGYQRQNVLSNTSPSHIQQPTAQYSMINERRNYQQNRNRLNDEKREGIQIQHFRNSNAQNVEQQRYEHRLKSENSNANLEEYINRNSMAPVIQKEFATTLGQQEREYLENKMSNDKELQKRKNLYARDGFAISAEGPKINKQSSIPIPELPKRQRYEDFSNNVINMKDTSSSHKDEGNNMVLENTPRQTDIAGFPNKNVINKPGDKVLCESYNLDDDEDIQLTINEDSFNTLFSLSQQNKNLLMKKYESRISEIDNLTQKYGDSDENNLEIASKKIAQVFQAVIEKIAKSYKTDKPQLKTQMINQYTQTMVQNKSVYMSDKVASPIIDVTVENPIDTVNYNENEHVNTTHAQQPNEMYAYNPNYKALQQYRNPSNQNQPNQNQGQSKQQRATAKESNPPFMHQMGHRFNRPQMPIPMEHQRSCVLPTCPNTHPVLQQVPQRPAQYDNVNAHWNFEQNNRRWMNNDPTQMNQFQEYQTQMMMHQRSAEQQRYYYQMELQRNAWAAQTGNYPRNDWT